MEQQEPEKGAPAEKKKGKGRLIGIVIAVVFVLGAGAAGIILGPKLFGGGAAPPANAAEEHEAEGEEEADPQEESSPKAKKEEAKAGEVHEVTNLQPIIVDVAANEGPSRHLKIALSIEHPENVKEADFKLYVPRARESAIALLRTKNYDELADPKSFDSIRKELNQTIQDAVGKKRVKRVLITDFVTQ